VTPALVLAAGVNDPGLVQACGPKGQQSWLCSTTYHITGSTGAAEVADALAKPIRIVVIFVVAWIAVRIARVLVNRFVEHTTGGVQKGVQKIASLGSGIAFVDTHPMSEIRRVQRARTVGAVLRSIVSILIWSIAVLTVLDELGVNLAPLIAGAGIAGIALGFGAQSLVKDFVTGLFMLLEDQYGVGDVIDTGVATGTVEGVSLRTTRLRDADGVVWHVPNGAIVRIGNKSQQWSRALVDVAIGYDADVPAATEVIRETALAVWRDPEFSTAILSEPLVLGVEALAPGQVIVRVTLRTRAQEQFGVERALRERIKAALDDAGIPAPSLVR
jgi:moderate conductance mechanosensitive channel